MPHHTFFCGKNYLHQCKQTPDLLKIKIKIRSTLHCAEIFKHTFHFSILAVQLWLLVTASYSAYTPNYVGQHEHGGLSETAGHIFARCSP